MSEIGKLKYCGLAGHHDHKSELVSEIRALREALERIDTRCNQAVSGSAMLSAMVIDVIEIARTALEQTKEQIE